MYQSLTTWISWLTQYFIDTNETIWYFNDILLILILNPYASRNKEIKLNKTLNNIKCQMHKQNQTLGGAVVKLSCLKNPYDVSLFQKAKVTRCSVLIIQKQLTAGKY